MILSLWDCDHVRFFYFTLRLKLDIRPQDDLEVVLVPSPAEGAGIFLG